MGKKWDQALPSIEIWKECLRVLKPGAFAFVMCIPRQDCLSRMIIKLEDAGFRVNFTPIFWTFATGFPKASNIGKMVDKKNGRTFNDYKQLGDYLKKKITDNNKVCAKKLGFSPVLVRLWRLGDKIPTRETWKKLKSIYDLNNKYDELIERKVAEREVIGKTRACIGLPGKGVPEEEKHIPITSPTTSQAKTLNGSYGGFQPKPAVEIIIVAMKPMNQKTFVDQAMDNEKGITWLDDGRIPYEKEGEDKRFYTGGKWNIKRDKSEHTVSMPAKEYRPNAGRFPANLLVSDDVLNDGQIRQSGYMNQEIKSRKGNVYRQTQDRHCETIGDSGSFSRYFSLDAWVIKNLPPSVRKTFPFLIVPKPSKAEKNKGCEEMEEREHQKYGSIRTKRGKGYGEASILKNNHPTCKPIKLMTYLITIGSRPGDIIMDPFCGSGTSCIAAEILGRKWIGYEIDKEYCKIAEARIKAWSKQRRLL